MRLDVLHNVLLTYYEISAPATIRKILTSVGSQVLLRRFSNSFTMRSPEANIFGSVVESMKTDLMKASREARPFTPPLALGTTLAKRFKRASRTR